MFNWTVANPNTQRSSQTAISDFETVTNLTIKQADAAALGIYHRSMKARGLAINTIRTRLAAVRLLSGINYPLPPKQKAELKTLDAEQIRAMMNVMEASERVALIKQLAGVYAPSLKPADDFMAHFMGTTTAIYTTQELTRKLKRCARLAGIEADQVSLRVWRESGKQLLKTLSPVEFAALLTHRDTNTSATAAHVDWKKAKLHGLGRRSFAKA